MCLSIPAKVISLEGNNAIVDAAGNQCEIGIDFVPELKIGDFVMIHSGYAIAIIDEKEAQETLTLLREFAQSQLP